MMRKIMREIMGDIEIIRSIWGMMKMMRKVKGEIIRSKTLTFEGCCREAVKQKTSMAMTVTVNLPSINGYARDGVNGGGEPAREPPSPCRLGPRLGPRVESGGSDTIVAAGERGEEQEEQGVEGSRRPTSSKRVSLEATFMDARMKARNSVFYTSGAQILEGIKEKKRLNSTWRKSALKEHKAFVTLGVVMGAFLICWLPFFTWYLTVTMCGEVCQKACPESLVVLLFWIGYFNSTLNPVIYAMTNRDFKLAFIGILKKLFCFCCMVTCWVKHY